MKGTDMFTTGGLSTDWAAWLAIGATVVSALALVALPDHPDKDYLGEHARATAWRAFDVLQAATRPATLRAFFAAPSVVHDYAPVPPGVSPRTAVFVVEGVRCVDTAEAAVNRQSRKPAPAPSCAKGRRRTTAPRRIHDR